VPGIIVGLDGSHNSQRALEVAINEAAIRHAPLTVIAVHQVVAGYSGHGVAFPGDDVLAEKARQAAQEEVDGVVAKLGDSQPASITVRGVSGLPAETMGRGLMQDPLFFSAALAGGSALAELVEKPPVGQMEIEDALGGPA